MSLEPNARSSNILGAIQTYVYSTLGTYFGLTVDYGGGRPFVDTGLAEWVQVRLLGPARPALLVGPRDAQGNLAQEIYWLVNINVFCRPAMQSTNVRIFQLRDMVLEAFREGTTIDVEDVLGTTGHLGKLVVFQVEDRPVEDEARKAELAQHWIRASARWLESWTTDWTTS